MCTRKIDLSFPAPYLSVCDSMLSFVNKKVVLWCSISLASQNGQIPSGHLLTSLPPYWPQYIILFTKLEGFPGTFPNQSLFSSQLLFWYLPCHLQSWKTVNCLPYQHSKEWLYPPYYFFIIVHRNFVLVLWCAGPHDVCYLEMVRFPGRRFHSLLYILLITKIHICLWSYKSYSDEIVILILHKYCYY